MRDFKKAERLAREVLAFDKEQTSAEIVMAHAMLFQGNFKKARPWYRWAINENYRGAYPFREMIKDDLLDFEKAGLQHPDLAKLRKLFPD